MAEQSKSSDDAAALATNLINQACALVFTASFPTSDTYALPRKIWLSIARDSLAEHQEELNRAEIIIKPQLLKYDSVSPGLMAVGNRTYSNAHMGAMETARQLVFMLSPPIGKVTDENDEAFLQSIAAKMYNSGLSLLGHDFATRYTAWISQIRLESARISAADRGKLSLFEEAIIKTLTQKGKRLTQLSLLQAAGEKESGTEKKLLSNMVERGVLENVTSKRDSRGRGYGLPEWSRA